MAIDERQMRLPPYVSYKSWLKMLDGLTKFVPDEIDSSYYRELLFSGSSAKKLRTALRFLGLIDDGNVPTGQLQRLVRALRGVGQEIKTEVLREIMQNAYPSLFTEDFSLKRATSGQLMERFEKLGVRGDIQRHCISFFLHLAADAELELSPHLAGRSRLGIGRKSIVLKSRERRRKAKAELLQQDETTIFDFSKLHPAIVGLIRELPAAGSGWEQKEQWKKAFEATIDLVYPSKNGS